MFLPLCHSISPWSFVREPIMHHLNTIHLWSPSHFILASYFNPTWTDTIVADQNISDKNLYLVVLVCMLHKQHQVALCVAGLLTSINRLAWLFFQGNKYKAQFLTSTQSYLLLTYGLKWNCQTTWMVIRKIYSRGWGWFVLEPRL